MSLSLEFYMTGHGNAGSLDTFMQGVQGRQFGDTTGQVVKRTGQAPTWMNVCRILQERAVFILFVTRMN